MERRRDTINRLCSCLTWSGQILYAVFDSLVKWTDLEGEKMEEEEEDMEDHLGERKELGHNRQVAKQVLHGQARFCMQCLMGSVTWTDLEGEKMKEKKE